MNRADPRALARQCQAGMTLLEVLIALTLLGFLVVVLNGGLAMGGRAWDRLGAGSDAASAQATGLEALRSLLEHITPVGGTGPDGEREVSFSGTGREIRFASGQGPLSPVPGVRFYRLSFDQDADRILLETGDQPLFGPQGARSRTAVLDDVAALSLAYAPMAAIGDGRGPTQDTWREEWPDRGRLPALIRIDIEYKKGARGPDRLVVAPRIAAHGTGEDPHRGAGPSARAERERR